MRNTHMNSMTTHQCSPQHTNSLTVKRNIHVMIKNSIQETNMPKYHDHTTNVGNVHPVNTTLPYLPRTAREHPPLRIFSDDRIFYLNFTIKIPRIITMPTFLADFIFALPGGRILPCLHTKCTLLRSGFCSSCPNQHHCGTDNFYGGQSPNGGRPLA